jgi:prepilin signal peptidase PulO-like enzyme (type II secretory pathway)
MGYIVGNVLPILIATLAGLGVGALYAAAAGRHMAAMPSAARRMGLILLSAVAEFWLACILAGALILAPNPASPWVMAVASAVVIWIGFVLPTLAVSYGFRRQSLGAATGDVLHWLAVMVVQAVVLQGIGLTHP